MERAEFEEMVLGYAREEHVMPHVLAGDIAQLSNRHYSGAEVREALLGLAEQGRVRAFILEAGTDRYIPITASEARLTENVWFYRGIDQY